MITEPRTDTAAARLSHPAGGRKVDTVDETGLVGTGLGLLSGEMSMLRWVQWLCVLLIWGVGLNALGAAALRRRGR